MTEECIKCGYLGENKRFGLIFCEVCVQFCPSNPEEVDKYSAEKIDNLAIESFRRYSKNRGQQQKNGMIKKASQGELVSRAPFGYQIENKKLVPAQNFREIEEIFEKFLEDKMSLNKLANKHNLSVNGLKKILSNFTYIGKIKFNNQIYNGNHKSLVDAILFNKVQDKLEKLSKKKN